MTSARDLVYDAMSYCGALGQGDVASASDAQLALRALNRMIDSWANDSLMVYVLTQETLALTAGLAAYTTATLSTPTRPAGIDPDGFLRVSNVDSPLRVVTQHEYNAVAYKPSEGHPVTVLYRPAMPHGTFTFYPVPNVAMVAHFNVRRVLTGTLGLTDEIALPPGYEEAIVFNLALRGQLFGMEPKPSVRSMAAAAKQALERQNYTPRIMSTPYDGVVCDNIFEG